jgi:hypothetical protein
LEEAADNNSLEQRDHLVRLLITQPLYGWEPEFEEITRREIERLYPLSDSGASNE